MRRSGSSSSGAARSQFRPPSFLRRTDDARGDHAESSRGASSGSASVEGSVQRLSSAGGRSNPFQRGPAGIPPPHPSAGRRVESAKPAGGSDDDEGDVFSHSIDSAAPEERRNDPVYEPRQSTASASTSDGPSSPSKPGLVEYWMCMWRKPQGRKHKTWDGDAVLIVDHQRGTCKLKCQESGRDLAFSSTLAGKVFESGAEMSLGGKEIEVDHEISQREYLSGIPDSYQWPASTKSLTKQANSRASPVSSNVSPPSRLMAPAPAASFYSKPLPKPKFKDPSHRGLSPEVVKALERQRDEGEAAVALKSSIKSNHGETGSALTTSRSKASSRSINDRAVPSPPPQPRPNGLYHRMDAPEPRYDPLAPNAIVMDRPTADHQARFNKRGDPIVDVVINPFLAQSLRPHQIEGVKFLYNRLMGLVNDEASRGAILADEMGLGKTLQTITLVETLLRQSPYYSSSKPRVIDKALIVCPLSLVKNWQREFRKWLGTNGSSNIGVVAVDGNKGKEVTQRFVTSKRDSVLLIGYEKLRSCIDILASAQPPIGLIVCDEGHRLKSKDAKTTKMFDQMSTDRRLILTGTPIQNDLSELYAMIDFVCPALLGEYSTFKSIFEDPILKSRMQYCSKEDRDLGQTRSKVLGEITRIVVLRRTADILDGYLKPKTEAVVFCSPTQVQIELYRHVLRSTEVRAVTSGSGGGAALPLILLLRQVCDTPELLLKVVEGKSTGKTSLAHEVLHDSLDLFPTKRITGDVNLSGKLIALSKMLKIIKDETDDKVVLVSTFSSTLDILEAFCKRSKYPFERLDGQTKQDDRIANVNSFNRTSRSQSFIFLLSTKAGGAGINLIGANRLFLMEPEWNPALDHQAMARIHRDGQKKHCYIYRMMMAGTMDEKIFQRQIQKLGISDALMGAGADADESDGDGDGNDGGKKRKRSSHAGMSSTSGSKKSGGDSFTPEELKDIFTLHENTPCLCHDQLLCSCGGRGELLSSQAQALLNSSQGDTDDFDPTTRGFVPASQHTAQSEIQHAREARARLAGLADWRHIETISGKRDQSPGADDGDDSENEDGFAASVKALADDAVLSEVVRRQKDAAKKIKINRRLAKEQVEQAKAAQCGEVEEPEDKGGKSLSLLEEMDLDALEASAAKKRTDQQKARAEAAAAKAAAALIETGSGGWRITDEEPGNIVYVLTRQSGGEKRKKKRSSADVDAKEPDQDQVATSSKSKLFLEAENDSDSDGDDDCEEDAAIVSMQKRQRRQQAEKSGRRAVKLGALDENDEEAEEIDDSGEEPIIAGSSRRPAGSSSSSGVQIKQEPGVKPASAPSQWIDDGMGGEEGEDEADEGKKRNGDAADSSCSWSASPPPSKEEVEEADSDE